MIEATQWDLFRTFDAVVREGGFAKAASALGLSQSTVSRHIALLESEARAPLFERTVPLRVTERGSRLRSAILPMVEAATAARSALESTPELHEEVTITTVGEVVRWVLAPRLADLYRAFPGLRVTLLADNRVHSLAGNEADLALRMARPKRGELVAKKLTVESFAFFASLSLSLHPQTPWMGLSGAVGNIAEQRHAAKAFGGRPSRLSVSDIDSLGIAVEAGLGVAVLPRLYASTLKDVVEVRPAAVGARDLGPIGARALWMVVHRSKRNLPKIRAVSSWLNGVFTRGA